MDDSDQNAEPELAESKRWVRLGSGTAVGSPLARSRRTRGDSLSHSGATLTDARPQLTTCTEHSVSVECEPHSPVPAPVHTPWSTHAARACGPRVTVVSPRPCPCGPCADPLPCIVHLTLYTLRRFTTRHSLTIRHIHCHNPHTWRHLRHRPACTHPTCTHLTLRAHLTYGTTIQTTYSYSPGRVLDVKSKPTAQAHRQLCARARPIRCYHVSLGVHQKRTTVHFPAEAGVTGWMRYGFAFAALVTAPR